MEAASNEQTDSITDNQEESKVPHPIAKSIDRFLSRSYDIQFSASILIPVASEIRKKRIDDCIEGLDKANELLEHEDDSVQARAIPIAIQAGKDLDVYKTSEIIRLLETSFFLSIFASYDAFIGQLIESIFLSKPQLFKRINRTLTISKIVSYSSLDDLKYIALQNEIETFRRGSYVDQFEALEKRHNIKLREFDDWPIFVEASQRRNLLAHCDGISSDQYYNVCEEQGFNFNSKEVGSKLDIGADYFYNALDTVTAVVVMLGQTLWRRIFPDDLALSDTHLDHILFNALFRGNWRLAKKIASFALSLPQVSDPVYTRIALVNYCIALKKLEDESYLEALAQLNWTDTATDFKMAYAIIKEDYKEAASHMLRIGEQGEMVHKEAYYTWPLMEDFNSSPPFLEAYEKIYGHPFAEEISEMVESVEESTERGSAESIPSNNDPADGT